jgi:hypothetical protein
MRSGEDVRGEKAFLRTAVSEVIRDQDLAEVLDDESVDEISDRAYEMMAKDYKFVISYFGVDAYEATETIYGHNAMEVNFLPGITGEYDSRIGKLDKLAEGVLAVHVLVELGLMDRPTYVVGNTNPTMARIATKRLGFEQRSEFEERMLELNPQLVIDSLSRYSSDDLSAIQELVRVLLASGDDDTWLLGRRLQNLLDERYDEFDSGTVDISDGTDSEITAPENENEKKVRIIADYVKVVESAKLLARVRVEQKEMKDRLRAVRLAKQVIGEA